MDKRLILVVEDEVPLSLALKDSLESEGYAVETATNGDEAMDHINKKRPSLILLDLLMPKQDGFFVLKQVKKNSDLRLIPVIVLSNLGGEVKVLTTADDFSTIAMYADDYLVKSQHPISEVITKIKEYLEGSKQVKGAPSVG